MILAPILVVFAGYTAASYGYILMRSWDITPRAWISPLHPYQWPGKGAKPPQVQPGQLFPGGAIAIDTTGAPRQRPPGVSPAAWQTFLECASRGGLCTPAQYKQIVTSVLSKIFG